MATGPPRFSADALRPELVEAVACDAARDAHRVAAFLDAVGLTPSPGSVRHLPGGFLLDLAAALRMLVWEEEMVSVHREAGLPSAKEAAREAFRSAAAGGPAMPGRISEAVFRLSLDRFAWSGRRALGAEILLDDPDEDALVEAMARFLWASRRSSRPEEGESP